MYHHRPGQQTELMSVYFFFFFFESSLLSVKAQPHVGLYILVCYSSGPQCHFRPASPVILRTCTELTPSDRSPCRPSKETLFSDAPYRNVHRSQCRLLSCMCSKSVGLLAVMRTRSLSRQAQCGKQDRGFLFCETVHANSCIVLKIPFIARHREAGGRKKCVWGVGGGPRGQIVPVG